MSDVPTVRDVPSPSLVGRYRIERFLGAGASGVVYAARHDTLDKPVALKLLRPELANDPAQAQRFLREARHAASLHHENIVDVTDCGADAEGVPYLVMELLRGRSLAELVRQGGALPWPRTVAILVQLARALGYAHESGLLHRDLKPHNVMIESSSAGIERVKLCDFGLSRSRSGNDRITATGGFVGTPAYVAPEQVVANGGEDERCDLYAFGVTAYEMLAGALPYTSVTPVGVIAEIMGDARVPLRERVASGTVPEALLELVDRCIARDPAMRPRSASEIERELLAIGSGPVELPADLTGQMIGSYRVIAPLGAGGHGAVWLAEHPVIGTKVAVKVLRPEIAAVPGLAERFVNEARAASLIASPHIAKYLDLGRLPSGQSYAILEYLDGESLQARVSRGPLAIDAALRIARQIASALVLAHASGIVHRDVKPDNVFLVADASGEHVKLLDFGIAKLADALDAGGPRTQHGFFMGTVMYCAPEQLLGASVGPAADVYALGATMFELFAGAPPFEGDATQIAAAKATQTAPPIQSRRADIPPRIAALVDAMLSTTVADRPAMDDVVAILDGRDPSLARDVIALTADELDVPPRRSLAPWIAGATAVVAIVIVAIVAATRPRAPAAQHVRSPQAQTAPQPEAPTVLVTPIESSIESPPVRSVEPPPDPEIHSEVVTKPSPNTAPKKTTTKKKRATAKRAATSDVIIADPFEKD